MTTTLPDLDRTERSEADDQPRRLSRRSTGADAAFVWSVRVVGASVLVITGGVAIFLGAQLKPTLDRYGLAFFTTQEWSPDTDVVGIAAVMVGSIAIGLTAMAMAFPLAVLMALYVSEYAPARLRSTLVSVIDLMAAVPSIVYGLWAKDLIMPHSSALARWMHQHLGWIPLFDVPGTDPSAPIPDATRYISSSFCASIAVAMMVMPMACAVMRQVFSQTPQGEKEAALALGATKWGVVTNVVLPFGRGGMIGGTMLGLGRALGETIAVLLIISPAFDIKWSLTEVGSSSVSALIAGRFSDASDAQLSALLAAGFALFLLTLAVNTVAALIVNRSRSGEGVDA
ncbi:phosphate ABC transporter permease subunit PstC [Nocardioides dongxiaopingii]|uniref:phosphate ABC transporter permease subunit PstC n=1 Tax=Nocardioides TaxID=1839 RepID=UPI001FE89E85|nr:MULTISPECIES: phosphate ABC transporter permease subunit PstC [Nocardioides]